jgi:REP element-mobilizing transposase RayT
VHVTLRMRPHVWSLRSQRGMAVVAAALSGAALRPGFRVARFSVQGNHLHLVVEAATAAVLTSGMKALAIRLARGMNRLMGSRGPVLEDRYHAHVLRTPAEVRRALAYVAENFANHARRRGEVVPAGFRDRFGSAARPELVEKGETWLLRRATTSAESSDEE